MQNNCRVYGQVMSGLKREIVIWSPILVKKHTFYYQQRVHSISKCKDFENKQGRGGGLLKFSCVKVRL